MSFAAALVLHLGWALALGVLLIAMRRPPRAAELDGVAFVALTLLFAGACAGTSAIVWGLRQPVVRWVRSLSADDLTAILAALGTGTVALGLVGLVAAALPGLSNRLSRSEMDVVIAGSLCLIAVVAISVGWVLIEGLGAAAPALPGRIEASLSRRRTE